MAKAPKAPEPEPTEAPAPEAPPAPVVAPKPPLFTREDY